MIEEVRYGICIYHVFNVKLKNYNKHNKDYMISMKSYIVSLPKCKKYISFVNTLQVKLFSKIEKLSNNCFLSIY